MSQQPSIVDFIRPLRVASAVAACGSTVAAAGLLNLSQSSVARAVQSLERALGGALFERAGRGMQATQMGALLARRTQRALALLAQADAQARRGGHDPNLAWAGSRLANNLGTRHLSVLLALAQHGSETAGARALGISQSAVHQTLAQLEHMAGTTLFQRVRKGLRPTEACELILRACKLARVEWVQAEDELAALRGVVQGRLVIGTLPFSTGELLSETVDQVLRVHPGVRVSIIDGTYGALLHQLRQADIDLIVGALRPSLPGSDLQQETLFLDRLAVVARAQHPLARRPRLVWRDLRDAAWIMPMPDTPAQTAFEQALAVGGIAPPADALRVNSALMMQAMLAQSDRLALMSPRQVRREIRAGLLVRLDLAVHHAPRAIGLVRRADYLPTPAAHTLLDQLSRVARRIAAEPDAEY